MVHGIVLTLRLLEIIGLDAPKISLGRWHPFQELVTTIASNTGQNPRRNAKSLLGCPSALPGGMPGFSMAWFQTPRGVVGFGVTEHLAEGLPSAYVRMKGSLRPGLRVED